MGLLQNEDFKTEAELISAGGAKTQLLNDTKIYCSAVSETLDDAITTGILGGGASGLITGNDNIPKSTIGNWLAYADTAGISPIDMTGGSPVVTITRNTTAPISDVADFLFTKPASNAQGNGFSLTKTSIPNKYKSRACMLRLKYFTSSTYVDNAVGLFLYDITGAVVYQLNPLYLKKSGLIESSFAEIQLPNTLTSGFRIGFHVVGTDTTAYTINFTEFTFDEKTTSQNSSITDPVAYTPTYGAGLGTVTTNKVSYSKSGKYLLMDGVFIVGTPATAEISLTLPSGLVVSTDISSAYYNIVGSLTGEALVGADQQITIITIAGATKLYFGEQRSNQGLTPLTAGATYFYSGQRISFSARIPIQGWSAGTQVSDIYTGRQIFLDAVRSTNQTGLNPNGSLVQIQLNAFNRDTVGMMNVGVYTASILSAGEYDLVGNIAITGPNVLNNQYYAAIKINGTTVFYGQSVWPAASAAFQAQVVGKRFLNVNDTVTLFMFGQGNNSASTITVDGNATDTYLQISKIQAPVQPLANEKVIESWETAAGTSYANAADLVLGTKVKSTHGIYNSSTGVLTCNKAGDLTIEGNFGSSNTNTATELYIYTRKNGADHYVISDLQAPVASKSYIKYGGKFPVNAGDTISVRIAHNGTSMSTSAFTFWNHATFTLE